LKFRLFIYLTEVEWFGTLRSNLGAFLQEEPGYAKGTCRELLGIGVGVAAMAAVTTPEIDPASAGSALALLAGTLIVVRGRHRK
jgi:hypothetical protein